VSGRAAGSVTITNRSVRTDRDVRREAGLARTGAERRTPERAAAERSPAGRAFEGIGRGGEVRRQSTWGRESLNSPKAGGAWAAGAARSFPQDGARVGDAVRSFPQGNGGGGFRGAGAGFRGGHR